MLDGLSAWLAQGWQHPVWQSPHALAWGLALLALWAFLAATLLPLAVEVALVALALKFPHAQLLLLAGATLGNTLGAATTFYSGWWLGQRRPLPVHWHTRKTHRMVQRWGYWALLLSWVPLAGDALVLLGGWLHMPPKRALGVLFLGKLLRFPAVLWLLEA